jgi:hypothetical protein
MRGDSLVLHSLARPVLRAGQLRGGGALCAVLVLGHDIQKRQNAIFTAGVFLWDKAASILRNVVS